MIKINIHDFDTFCKAYCINYSPYENKSEFKLREYQKNIIESISKHNYNIIGKSRQMGLSKLFQLYTAYLILNEQSILITVLSFNRESSRRFIEGCRQILNNVYSINVPPYSINNVSEIQLLNNTIKVYSQYDQNIGRKEYKNKIFIADEIAYNPDFESNFNNTISYNFDKYILFSSSYEHNSYFNNIWINQDNKYQNWNRIICLYNELNDKQKIVYKSDETHGWYSIEPAELDSEYISNFKKIYDNKKTFDIEMCFKHLINQKNNDIDNKKTININIRIDTSLYNKLKEKSLIDKITISDYIRNLIQTDLK